VFKAKLNEIFMVPERSLRTLQLVLNISSNSDHLQINADDDFHLKSSSFSVICLPFLEFKRPYSSGKRTSEALKRASGKLRM
jgi:hypothetical protein